MMILLLRFYRFFVFRFIDFSSVPPLIWGGGGDVVWCGVGTVRGVASLVF